MTTPPPPPGPPTVHLHRPAQQPVDRVDTDGADDWWSLLYPESEDAPAAADEDPTARRVTPPADRLPDWRTGERVNLDKAPADGDEAEPEFRPEPMAEPVFAGLPEAGEAPEDPGWAPAGAPGIDLSPRARHLVYSGSAAAAGYAVGLAPALVSALNAIDARYSAGTALAVGVGLVLLVGQVIDRRTRAWWGPLPWITRIPLASAVLALCLYGTHA